MRLTDHQRNILALLHAGKTYQQVADKLRVSPSSISANLYWCATQNQFASITDLRTATKHIDLSRSSIIKRTRPLAGIAETRAGTYQVTIWYGKRKRAYVGTFRTREQAIAARLEAEKKYRGIPS